MAESNTSICNQALGKIGAQRINDFEDDTESSAQAIQCRLHFEPTRDALLRSHYWPFASARKTLSQDDTDPDFEWDNQFILPTDFLYLKSIFDNSPATNNSRHSHAIEGERILTNDNEMKIRYVKKVTDASKFDPLFVKVLVLLLADEMIGPLAGGDVRIQKKINDVLDKLMPRVRALSRQEANLEGRAEQFTWVDVRATRGGRIDSRLGSA